MRRLLFSLIAALFLQSALWGAPAGAAASRYPEKIVSLGPVITDMIYLLGAQDRLAGVTSYCRIPEGSPEKTVVGTVMQMNVEKIIALQPDLVVSNALTSKKQARLLKRHGIRVIEIETPENFGEICSHFIRLGRLVGREAKAEKIVRAARQKVAAVRRKAEKHEKKSVFIQIGVKPLKTSPGGTFIHEYITFAGGINIAEGARGGVFSRETVLKENPGVILIATMGSSKRAGDKEKQTWQQFSHLKAVKNGDVHVLDPDIVCSPTPETFVEGVETFFRLIHKQTEQKAEDEG